ncbi:MAG TPA: ABC transporter ATP-binding protein [Actinomycetota bacterium]|nr:ABC transporter ATP-binding protein [Actinomycetota bacterium]
MSGGLAVALVGVVRRYEAPGGTVTALDGVTLSILPGESVAVTGPSGCGKSTLLGLIAGLDVPTTGTVTIGDRVISSMDAEERARARRHDLGLVFQSDNLLPYLTATENVSAQIALDDRVGAYARSVEVLVASGLAGEVDALPDQLSGGQRQRVAVARAIAHHPKLIVADEPTGSLDPPNATAVVDLLLSAQRASGATLVLVTHEASVADRLQRVVSLRDGRPIGDSAPTSGSAS